VRDERSEGRLEFGSVEGREEEEGAREERDEAGTGREELAEVVVEGGTETEGG
jgi:hypothetical protein